MDNDEDFYHFHGERQKFCHTNIDDKDLFCVKDSATVNRQAINSCLYTSLVVY